MNYRVILLFMILFCFMQVSSAHPSQYKMGLIYVGSDYFNPQTTTGGDLTSNQHIQSYIPKTNLSDEVCYLAKLGTPIIVMGDGKGPRVMITAGVHGNELPAQIAAMKLINYLDGKDINGTVYIVPFVSPNGTSETLRYWNNQNLNSKANTYKTPSNAIILVCKNLGVEKLADFHSTQPGGDPGNYSVLCSKTPRYESYLMAEYISTRSNSSLISYDKAGVDYHGAVEDVANLNGISAVTCEVLSPHGIANNETANRSFDQMIKFLEYSKII